ncbi:unnamed protein product [Owenia fusiformis]|uniref:Chitin-binding type-2 domain-containing protein n=1 Tax=Owenia fusiformis TaxID=6347 RepID=A0A8S4Q891_OWEFU|nr:unnamed protein product [Owenia fusiformis]
MMKYKIAIFAISCFMLCGVSAQYQNCTGREDGIYKQLSCTRYVECIDEVETISNCAQGEVFDIIDRRCEPSRKVSPPCGDKMNCTGLANDRYPYYDRNCTWYYTCRNEKMIGIAQECVPGAVFDYDRQACTYASDVCPPCGTGDGFVVNPCTTDSPQYKVKAKIDKMTPQNALPFGKTEN